MHRVCVILFLWAAAAVAARSAPPKVNNLGYSSCSLQAQHHAMKTIQVVQKYKYKYDLPTQPI